VEVVPSGVTCAVAGKEAIDKQNKKPPVTEIVGIEFMSSLRNSVFFVSYYEKLRRYAKKI
jgi:hypothetical protein